MAKKKNTKKKQGHLKLHNEENVNFFFEQEQNKATQSAQRHNFFKHFDFDPIRFARRKKAFAKLMPEVMKIALTIWPDIPDIGEIERDWARANAKNTLTYDIEESAYATNLGAAIWILDQLRTCGKLEAAIQLLPSNTVTQEMNTVPDIWDTCYSTEIIKGMVWIIRNRNNDCEILANTSETVDENFPSYFMDLATTRNKHRQDVPSRNLYKTIIEMIPENSIKEAVTSYENAFWDWIKRYYQCWTIYQKEKSYILERQDELALIEQKIVSQKSHTHARHLEQLDRDFYRLPESFDLDGIYHDLAQKINFLHIFLRSHEACLHRGIRNELGEVFADYWKDFNIADPYQFSFAFLHLVDSGSDLPWLYFPGTAIYYWFACRLPWKDWKLCPDSISYIWGDKSNLENIITNITAPTDCYKLHFQSTYDPSLPTFYNLGHIIYNQTGCILPRDVLDYTSCLNHIRNSDNTGYLCSQFINTILNILGHARNRQHPIPNIEAPVEDSLTNVPCNDTKEIEELRIELAGMKSEVQQLKQELYAANKDLRIEKEMHCALIESIHNEREELINLRELIFELQNSPNTDPKGTTSVKFPYSTSGKIIVFGGHDSWLREIKEKLPDVRFLGKEQIPNVDLIRNADIVWIQPNAISHGFFYRITNETHKHNIPVRYFSNASAEICALQLIEAMDKLSKK